VPRRIRCRCRTSLKVRSSTRAQIVIDPRFKRTAVHATEYVRGRPRVHIPTMYGHFTERLGGQGIHPAARLWNGEVRKEAEKWPPAEVERVTGLPEAQVRRIAKIFAKEKSSTLIWAMGQTSTRSAPPTCARAASCCSPLATSAGWVRATIFRDHDNVQSATDLGLHLTTLPL
jgi:formate dehydrogenase major subunit